MGQVSWQEISDKGDGPYESGLLKLNCDKALHQLGWRAIWNFERTVQETVEWYRPSMSSKSLCEYEESQILRYQQDAKELGYWAQ